jgi:hypothetical protein
MESINFFRHKFPPIRSNHSEVKINDKKINKSVNTFSAFLSVVKILRSFQHKIKSAKKMDLRCEGVRSNLSG